LVLRFRRTADNRASVIHLLGDHEGFTTHPVSLTLDRDNLIFFSHRSHSGLQGL